MGAQMVREVATKTKDRRRRNDDRDRVGPGNHSEGVECNGWRKTLWSCTRHSEGYGGGGPELEGCREGKVGRIRQRCDRSANTTV